MEVNAKLIDLPNNNQLVSDSTKVSNHFSWFQLTSMIFQLSMVFLTINLQLVLKSK